MALYIKYRPKTFDELVKQEHITNILKPKVASNDRSHSNYLFYGPRGTGKTSTARIFAKAINCTNIENGNPCDQCDSCIIINSGKTFDIIEIDAASYTGVDNIREEILDKAIYPPAQLKKKVYIIDEVHMLSKSSFNALLKIIEEPPHYLVFILATTEINKVPETIISRCQIFTFKKIPVVDLVKHLTMICEKEGFKYTNEALVSIAKIADGCARDAVKYLDQVSILGDISQDHVTSFLGVASDQLVQGFLEKIIDKDTNAVFTIVDSLHETGVDIGNFIKQCLVYIEEHFSENVPGYMMCTDILKRILYGLKNFPLPTILMKMEIYNTFNSSSELIVTKTDGKLASDSKKIEKTVDTVKKQENVPAQEETTKKEEITEKKTPSENREKSDLLQKIADHEDIKSNITSILEKSCILEQNNDSATLYVFNKIQGSILQKAENRSGIEKIFKQELGVDYGLQIVITTKEEYLAMKL